MNTNNNTETIIPVGAHQSFSPAVATTLTVPDDATGCVFTSSGVATFTLDGTTTPDASVGINLRLQTGITFLHLYPGAPITFFSATGIINLQFYRTGDTYSVTSRR